MKIDIDSMGYEELVELNHKIVERLKFLDLAHAHNEMMQKARVSDRTLYGDQKVWL